MLKKLWADEGGAILSSELILIMTILVIGLVVGLKAVQDAVVTELGDVAAAVGSMNQSFATAGTQLCGNGNGNAYGNAGSCAWTSGSTYLDLKDQCEKNRQSAGDQGPLGIVVCGGQVAAVAEGEN